MTQPATPPAENGEHTSETANGAPPPTESIDAGAQSAPDAATGAAAPADTAEETKAVGTLPETLRTQLMLRQQQGKVSAAIAKLNWGKQLDYETRRAIAAWGERHAVDVMTEINILGGNVYKNATYYLNRLARLVRMGIVEYAVADHIEVDPRLDALIAQTDDPELAARARKEKSRRTEERIHHGLPDKAISAVVFRLKLTNVPTEFTGAKWAGNRGKTESGKLKDPVGEEFPVETVESRAARRCLRFVADREPTMYPLIEGETEDGTLEVVEEKVQAAFDKLRSQLQLGPGVPVKMSRDGGYDMTDAATEVRVHERAGVE